MNKNLQHEEEVDSNIKLRRGEQAGTEVNLPCRRHAKHDMPSHLRHHRRIWRLGRFWGWLRALADWRGKGSEYSYLDRRCVAAVAHLLCPERNQKRRDDGRVEDEQGAGKLPKVQEW
jgi:hypothetical protein